VRRDPYRPGEPADDLQQVARHKRCGMDRPVPQQHGLLRDQLEFVVEFKGVVGADLGAEPVLQRGHDAARLV